MKFSREHGVEIDERMRSILNKAVQVAGSRLQLSKRIGVGFSTLSNWYGNNYRKGEYITWEQWRPLRDFLERNGLLETEMPQWMLPSELLAEVERLRGQGSEVAVANGAGAAAAAGHGAQATALPPPASEADAMRRLTELASWILACEELSPEAKLQAMSIIHAR